MKNKKNKNKHTKQNKVIRVVEVNATSAREALAVFQKAYATECANRNIQQTDEGYCNYLRACFLYMNAEDEACVMNLKVISEYFSGVSMVPETMEIANEVEKIFGNIFGENGVVLNDDNVLHFWEALVLEANLNRDARTMDTLGILARFRALLYV